MLYGLYFAAATYNLKQAVQTPWGYHLDLELASPGPYPPDITHVSVQIYHVTQNIVRIKIYDASSQRFEVPHVVQLKMPEIAPQHVNYKVTWNSSPFGFTVTRTTDNTVIFSTLPDRGGPQFSPLIFEDQYIEISSVLPTNPNIYGLGERVSTLRLDASGKTYTLWSRDRGTPYGLNLYGVHPFYLEMRDGKAHGVFLLNANAMDVILQSGAITYKVIGGIPDLWFFMGPTPSQVVAQYTEVIGRPHFPPYWGLGWHQCRWGYQNINQTVDVVTNYKKYHLPLDTMWNDIDYMYGYRDFTVDPFRFPLDQVKAFTNSLHREGRHYIQIVDPGIYVEPGYPPYDQGIVANVFIKDKTGKNFLGKVWPGLTNFPDFTHPNAFEYWYRQISTFRNSGVGFDGLWIDMNEISNFCNGECQSSAVVSSSQSKGGRGTQFDPDNPPFKPQNGGNPLNAGTLDLSALHYTSLEYNLHSLYGHYESMATSKVLETYFSQRSVVISRSTFAGTGHHAGHWLGDNYSSFNDMYLSLPGIMTMNMFGIPFVGADICGFGGDATEELCTRWMEIGVFYPFSRNHNSYGQRPQEPYAFSSRMTNISRNVLLTKYSLLPYYYTLFFLAHTTGSTVARPLFFEYYSDPNTLTIDRQMMIGPSLLLSPVLEQGATTVKCYFPRNSVWYDFYTGEQQVNTGQYVTLDAPIDKINIHVAGGGIIPMQEPAETTTASRLNPFNLLVALSANGIAAGELFWDDGVSLNSVERQEFTRIIYKASNNTLTAQVVVNGYVLKPLQVNTIKIYGIPNSVNRVLVNNSPHSTFTFNADTKALFMWNLQLPMDNNFTVVWS